MKNQKPTIVLANDAQTIAGGERYVLFLADELRAREYPVHLAVQHNSELAHEARRRGFHTEEFSFGRNGRELIVARRIAAAFRKLQPDIVHTNSNYDRTAGAIAARMLGAKSIASIHSCLSIQHNVTHWFRNRYLIDHFTPVGYSTRAILIEQDRIPAEKISVVHIGIPEDQIRTSPVLRESVRAEFGFDEEHVVLGTLSRLVPFKGHTVLLSAAVDIFSALPDVRILIVGDGELRPALESEARSLGISDRVRFAGQRNDLSSVLSAFDLFIQPSIDFGGETFPLSIIEAQAAGLPVIASEVGDIRHIIDHGRSGFLVKPSTPEALAERIIELASDRNRRKQFGERARLVFLERLRVQSMVDAMEDVYRAVLGWDY